MLEEQAKQSERTMNKIILERQAEQLREILENKDIKTVSGNNFYCDFNNKKVEAEIQYLTGERTAEQIKIIFKMINVGAVLVLEISEINQYGQENIAKISTYDHLVVISIDRLKRDDNVSLKDTIYIDYN
jgi:hypothetical protein